MRSKLQTYEPTITPGRVARVAHARRYGEIIAVLIKYGFDDAVRAWHLAPPLRAGRRLMALAGRRVEPEASRARRMIGLAFGILRSGRL